MLHSRSHCDVCRGSSWPCSLVAAASWALLGSAGAVDPASITAANDAVAWIITQQQPDGGFDVSGSQGFETPDAVLAIAEAAQTPGTPWNTATAFGAVTAIEYGGAGGPNPLDSLDDWADSPVNAGEAGKLIALVTEPLGLDPTDFDPSGDSGTAVDLTEILDPDGCAGDPATYGFFNETIFGALGEVRIVCACQPGGDRNHPGRAAGRRRLELPRRSRRHHRFAISTPRALRGPGLGRGRGHVRRPGDRGRARVHRVQADALGWLPTRSARPIRTRPHRPWWRSPLPGSTQPPVAGATRPSPPTKGTAYAAPYAWLRSQQLPERAHRRVRTMPSAVNTFATSQSVEALLLSWWPIARATGAPTCVPDDPGGSTEPVPILPLFTG